MVREIVLDDFLLKVETYQEAEVNGRKLITIDFKVTHEEYHDVTTLLYKGTFTIKVPEHQQTFRGRIQEYYTSVTNLYEKDQVGDFHVSFIETEKEGSIER
ncbi:DUF3219 family protein [Neobacillus sp. D3-1R]|uniref:DUF3219 family protein n=1 Tax=Neobacillus sp. D3-1R TaxID=3445778 RepID=UPI003FA0152A